MSHLWKFKGFKKFNLAIICLRFNNILIWNLQWIHQIHLRVIKLFFIEVLSKQKYIQHICIAKCLKKFENLLTLWWELLNILFAFYIITANKIKGVHNSDL